MSDHNVAIFWDYENCSPPSNISGQGYDIVNNIRRIARLFGSVTTFRAYLDISAQSPESESVQFRSELQSSGVSMMYCNHKGKKDIVDKMILVDMLAFAIDHRPPSTIVLITSDRDYAYALSILKLRKYQVVLVVPSSTHTSPALENQASLVIDWDAAILRNKADFTEAVRQPCRDLNPSFVAKLLAELRDDDAVAVPYLSSTSSQPTAKLRRADTCNSQHPYHVVAAPKESTGVPHDPASELLAVPRAPSCSCHVSASSGSTRTCSTIFITQSPMFDNNATAGSVSTPNCCVVESESPIMAPEMTLAGSVSTRDNDGNSEWSNPHRTTATDAFESNYRPYSTSSTMYSPSHRNMGFSPSNSDAPPRHVVLSPAASFLRLISDDVDDDGDDSSVQYPVSSETSGAVYLSAQDTASVSSSSFPSPPSTTAEGQWRNEGERGQKYTKFKPLIDFLIAARDKGDVCSLRSTVGTYLVHSDKEVYQHAGVSKFKAYIALAEQEGIVELGGKDSDGWVALHPNWSWVANEDSTSVLSNAVLSPPSTTAGTLEHNEGEQGQNYAIFKPLVDALHGAQEKGDAHPLSSIVGTYLLQSDKEVYRRAGMSKFKAYIALAEKQGIVEIGGNDPGNQWVALRPNWFEATSFKPPTTPSPKPILAEASNIMSTICTGRKDDTVRTVIPPKFKPLIDLLVRKRAEGFDQPRRSLVGQELGQAMYDQVGIPGFKEYVHQALDAKLVQCGGTGGHAWIGLHPELRI